MKKPPKDNYTPDERKAYNRFRTNLRSAYSRSEKERLAAKKANDPLITENRIHPNIAEPLTGVDRNCVVFACGVKLSPLETLFSDKCLKHQSGTKFDVTSVLFKK